MAKQDNRGFILDGISRLLALLQSEVQYATELVGFVVKDDLLQRLEVVQRFERHLSDISEWWQLPEGRLKDAFAEIESVLGGFRATQMGYLRKAVPWMLTERLKALRGQAWFSYRRAQDLADGLERYIYLSKGSSLAELRSSYIDLERKFSSAEDPSTEERIHAVMDSTPASPRPDRKRDKRLRDQALRQELKGPGGSKPQRGSNPKTVAKRERKLAQVKGKKVRQATA